MLVLYVGLTVASVIVPIKSAIGFIGFFAILRDKIVFFRLIGRQNTRRQRLVTQTTTNTDRVTILMCLVHILANLRNKGYVTLPIHTNFKRNNKRLTFVARVVNANY